MSYIALLCIIRRMKLTKDLVAASTAPLILSILRDGENYGYAIIQRVRSLSNGEIAWTDGMLYPVLHRLEEQGWIESRWDVADNGRKRKYYAITRVGRRALAEQKEQWRLVQQTFEQLWGRNMHEQLQKMIAQWRQELAEKIGTDAGVLDELEGHLHEEIDMLIRQGQLPEQAFAMAAAKIGAPNTLAPEFAKLAAPWWPIRAVAFGVLALIVGVFVLVGSRFALDLEGAAAQTWPAVPATGTAGWTCQRRFRHRHCAATASVADTARPPRPLPQPHRSDFRGRPVGLASGSISEWRWKSTVDMLQLSYIDRKSQGQEHQNCFKENYHLVPKMTSTPISLLDRLKIAPSNSPDWSKFHDIYGPLIKAWLARISGTEHESDDLVQEVLVVLIRELHTFKSQGKGSFRAWLRQITVNQTRAYFKKSRKRPRVGLTADEEQFLSQLEDSNSDLSKGWDEEHDRHVSQKLLLLVKNDFAASTWSAFCQFALEGKPAGDVAKNLGISENAVLISKSRILKRLRHEAGDFLT